MRILLLVGDQECDKCRAAKAIIGRVVARFPSVETATLHYEHPEAARYGIVMAPTVVVDDTIIASGRAPNEKKLTAFVEQQVRSVAR